MGKLNIFVDFDSVVVNCTKGFAQKFGLKMPEKVFMEYGYFDDYWTMENRALLDHDFWVNLELYPWSLDLIKLVERYDPDFKFLTACIAFPGCYSGKYQWAVDKLGPKYANRVIMCYKDKTFAAKRNALLIDDKNDNCTKWIHAGGAAYQWKERTEDMVEESAAELELLDLVIDGYRKKDVSTMYNKLISKPEQKILGYA